MVGCFWNVTSGFFWGGIELGWVVVWGGDYDCEVLSGRYDSTGMKLCMEISWEWGEAELGRAIF